MRNRRYPSCPLVPNPSRATLGGASGTHFARKDRNPSTQSLPLYLDKPMNVYPEEVADSAEPAKLRSKVPESHAGEPNSSHSTRRGKPRRAAALLCIVILAMGFWSLSRQLAPESASPEATALAVL